MGNKLFHVHQMMTGLDACSYNRMLMPSRYCGDKLKEEDILLTVNMQMPEMDAEFDVAVWHGMVGGIESVIGRGTRWQMNGKQLVWSVDDDYRCLPPWNPVKINDSIKTTVAWSARSANHILTSTRTLAGTFQGRPNVHTAPNLLELPLYVPKPRSREQVRFMYAGSATHREDMAQLIDAVGVVLDKYPQAEFFFFGDCHPELRRKHLFNGLTEISHAPIKDYWDIITTIAPDVWLAPLVDCQFSASKCVVGSTRVVTPKGIVRMDSMKNRLSNGVTLESKKQNCKEFFSYEQRETIKVTTSMGYTIEGTPNHKLRTSHGEWVSLGDIAKTPNVKIDLQPFSIDQTDYQEISYPMLLTKSIRQDLTGMDDRSMMPKITINEGWGRLLGYLMGDGCINGKCAVGISGSIDYPDVNEDCVRLLTATGLRPKIDRIKKDVRRANADPELSAKQPHPDRPWKTPRGVNVRASSGHLTSILQDMGIKGVRGKVFRVPEVIWMSPKSVIREFLRGLFESDGTVSCGEGSCMSLCSKSLELVQDVQILLMGFGIIAKIQPRLNANYKRLYYILYLGREGCDEFFRKINFISKKKQDRLLAISKKPRTKKIQEWTWSDTVVSADYGVADVFDIEVETDHYYLANGFASHNSNLKVIEGMALGAAVVASDVEPYRDMIQTGQNAIIVDPEEPDEWTEVLCDLVENETKRKLLIAAGTETVQTRYNWARPECREPWLRYYRALKSAV